MDAELLIEENMGRLTMAARKLSRNFGVPDMTDDLIQEGSLALMEAAKRYDTSGDTSFDAYSDRIIKSAMLDYIYRNATQFTMPPDRFRVLRRIARLLADGGEDLAVRLNYNSPGTADKAYKRAEAELRRIINAREYGRWMSALQAVRRASAEAPQTDCHIPWSEVNNLAEQFIAHVAILQRVYSILSEY